MKVVPQFGCRCSACEHLREDAARPSGDSPFADTISVVQDSPGTTMIGDGTIVARPSGESFRCSRDDNHWGHCEAAARPSGETFLPGGGESADYWRGYHAALAALARPGLYVKSARLRVHIDQQLNDGLCKYGEDHRQSGPCHRIVSLVLDAQQREGAGS